MDTNRPSHDLRVLTDTGFFEGTDEDSLTPLLREASRREYKRRDVIVEAGEEAGLVFLLARGLARLDRLDPDGSRFTVELLEPGDLHGAAHAAPDVAIRSQMTAVVDGTAVYRIPAKELEQWLSKRPASMHQALGIAYRRLGRAFDLAAGLRQQPVPVRLARLLCAIAMRSPNFEVHETQEDMAALVGASREEVARVLRDFRRRGLVESLPRQRGLRVPDPHRLAEEIATG